MVTKKNNPSLVWGFILIFLGLAFFFDEIGFIDFGNLISTFWPVALILVGLRLIMNREKAPESESVEAEPFTDSRSRVNRTTVFGDVALTVKSGTFEGGNAATVFGNIDVDLTEVDITQGEKIVSVNGVMGDVNVRVPGSIKWAARTSSVFGDIQIKDEISTGMMANKTYYSENYANARQKLFLSISQVFGDISIQELETAARPTSASPPAGKMESPKEETPAKSEPAKAGAAKPATRKTTARKITARKPANAKSTKAKSTTTKAEPKPGRKRPLASKPRDDQEAEG